MRLKKYIILFITFLLINTGIVFMVSFIGDYTNKLIEYQTLNNDYIVINQPHQDIKDFIIENYCDDVIIYSLDYVEVDSDKYLCYYIVGSADGFYIKDDTLNYCKFTQELEFDKIYQSHKIIDEISISSLHLVNLPSMKSEDYEVLFKISSIDQLQKDSIFMFKLKRGSSIDKLFSEKFPYDYNKFYGSTEGYFCTDGETISSYFISFVKNFFIFVFIAYLIPLILDIILIVYIYKIIMGDELKYFKIKHEFYLSEEKIIRNESLISISMNTISYLLIIFIYNLFSNLLINITNYLLIAYLASLIAVYLSIRSTVKYALTKKQNWGDE